MKKITHQKKSKINSILLAVGLLTIIASQPAMASYEELGPYVTFSGDQTSAQSKGWAKYHAQGELNRLCRKKGYSNSHLNQTITASQIKAGRWIATGRAQCSNSVVK